MSLSVQSSDHNPSLNPSKPFQEGTLLDRTVSQVGNGVKGFCSLWNSTVQTVLKVVVFTSVFASGVSAREVDQRKDYAFSVVAQPKPYLPNQHIAGKILLLSNVEGVFTPRSGNRRSLKNVLQDCSIVSDVSENGALRFPCSREEAVGFSVLNRDGTLKEVTLEPLDSERPCVLSNYNEELVQEALQHGARLVQTDGIIDFSEVKRVVSLRCVDHPQIETKVPLPVKDEL